MSRGASLASAALVACGMAGLRVAASLLLATWVLLQPPVDGSGGVETSAPLGAWVVNGRFATAKACEENKSQSEAAVLYGLSRDADGADAAPAAAVVMRSKCIELDDLKRRLNPAPPSE